MSRFSMKARSWSLKVSFTSRSSIRSASLLVSKRSCSCLCSSLNMVAIAPPSTPEATDNGAATALAPRESPASRSGTVSATGTGEARMSLKLVGAGLGRTGTHSLKLALEQVLGAPCYHMSEVFEHLDHVPTWHAALRGEQVDWQPVLGDYAAIVDWPGAGVWRDLAAAYPDALVLLSTRSDAASWLKSARSTILGNGPENKMEDDPSLPGFVPMVRDMFARFEPNWRDDDAALAAYERHNDQVRREVPAERLVEWQPRDGWGAPGGGPGGGPPGRTV